jgi:ferritin-like metal-binding protein YciE
MPMNSLSDLLEEELKDLYSAENQLLKALPKMARAATSETLQEAFELHLEETAEQVRRLEQIGEMLGIKMRGKVCKAMQGLVEEAKEVLEEDGEGAVIDCALIGAAQRVEH